MPAISGDIIILSVLERNETSPTPPDEVTMICDAISHYDRYYIQNHVITACYSLIARDHVTSLAVHSFLHSDRPQHLARVENIGLGGICLCVGKTELDLGRKVALTLVLGENESAEDVGTGVFVAEVIWLLETPKCRQVGLKFLAVPQDFADTLDNLAALADTNVPGKRH
jgi:hypothetical protein